MTVIAAKIPQPTRLPDHDQDGLDQAEAEDDPEGAQDPVDRSDVGAGPDPHLLDAGGILVLLWDRLDAVCVEANLRHLRFCHVPTGLSLEPRDAPPCFGS